MAVKEKPRQSTNGNGLAHAQEATPIVRAEKGSVPQPASVIPQSIAPRRDHRKKSAHFWQCYEPATQAPNGDETDYPDRRGNFTKGLPHMANGLVDPNSYQKLLTAMTTGGANDFLAIPTATPSVLSRQYVNPQAGLAVELIGADPTQLSVPAAPKFNSIANVAEIVENYWMALLRDVSFTDYQNSALVQDAVDDFEQALSSGGTLRQTLFAKDALAAGQPLTAGKLFRGIFVGEQEGPYLSQFLLQDCFIGAQQIDAKMRTVLPGLDYMTSFGDWLTVQRGVKQAKDAFDTQARYIRNGRDLGQWVHVDQLYQAYLLAALRLLDGGAKLSDSNPYQAFANQQPFGTFGGPNILSLVTEVATRALKAVWYQKWAVHRRLRPEVFAARIHTKFLGGGDGQTVDFDIASAIGEVTVTNRIYSAHGSLLLPMAFPEGSPMHPAYGAGHGTVAGACTTILKACFQGAQKFNMLHHPVDGTPLTAKQSAHDGLSLMPYTGADTNELTIEGELNKLAGNIAIGRNFAGVHWRSDYRESLLLGEKVAISTLMDYAASFNEPNVAFHFNSFTGRSVIIADHQVWVDGTPVIQQAVSFGEELAGLN